MEQQPLVSVIINCYNGEKYLREAIDSVIAQTYTNWEIIFWDNQSTDGTRAIVESYNNPKIHYIYAPTHTPLGEARNLAVEKASGEYINFLDVDDYWDKMKLQIQMESIATSPNISFVFSNFEIKLSSESYNRATYSLFKRIQKKEISEDIYNELLHGNFIVFSSVLFNKNLFLSVGGINPVFEQNEDYDILLKCSNKQKALYVRYPLTFYRIHSTNSSNVNGKNGSLGFYENRLIFEGLPKTRSLKHAIEENEVRIAVDQIRQKHYASALHILINRGNFFSLLRLGFRKFVHLF